ncbi:MAG: hypothetical protein K9I94_02110 [Bacteroidales bacterium]|nr:hypothetical protein [Bacteroidales bacterium]
MPTFFTAINCMDGRVQLPVNEYLKKRYQVDYIDMITEPGPNGILAKMENQTLISSIEGRINISVEKHASKGIAVIGHHDCAGNPVDKEEQNKHTRQAIDYLKSKYPSLPVIGLWVNEDWLVEEA